MSDFSTGGSWLLLTKLQQGDSGEEDKTAHNDAKLVLPSTQEQCVVHQRMETIRLHSLA